MSAVNDLLIIYADGSEKIIPGVSSYESTQGHDAFSFTKNGYRSFVSKEHVRFFGRRFDYEN